jgi:hypothetical protein
MSIVLLDNYQALARAAERSRSGAGHDHEDLGGGITVIGALAFVSP